MIPLIDIAPRLSSAAQRPLAPHAWRPSRQRPAASADDWDRRRRLAEERRRRAQGARPQALFVSDQALGGMNMSRRHWYRLGKSAQLFFTFAGWPFHAHGHRFFRS